MHGVYESGLRGQLHEFFGFVEVFCQRFFADNVLASQQSRLRLPVVQEVGRTDMHRLNVVHCQQFIECA